jgi:hypothetical protein
MIVPRVSRGNEEQNARLSSSLGAKNSLARRNRRKIHFSGKLSIKASEILDATAFSDNYVVAMLRARAESPSVKMEEAYQMIDIARRI